MKSNQQKKYFRRYLKHILNHLIKPSSPDKSSSRDRKKAACRVPIPSTGNGLCVSVWLSVPVPDPPEQLEGRLTFPTWNHGRDLQLLGDSWRAAPCFGTYYSCCSQNHTAVLECSAPSWMQPHTDMDIFTASSTGTHLATASRTCGSCSHFLRASTLLVFRCGRASRKIASDHRIP